MPKNFSYYDSGESLDPGVDILSNVVVLLAALMLPVWSNNGGVGGAACNDKENGKEDEGNGEGDTVLIIDSRRCCSNRCLRSARNLLM